MDDPHDLDVLIVGAGFSGLAMGIELLRNDLPNFQIWEAAPSLGGTWRDNTYPGAACDVESHLYSLSYALSPSWTRRFAPQPEILDYLHDLAQRFHLTPHLHTRRPVLSADFDPQRGRWTVTGPDGLTASPRLLIPATGGLSRPKLPPLPGLASLQIPHFHSARWNHDLDLQHLRVGVIGTGASAIQFVPQIAPRVRELLLFQRTPPWILPKPDGPIPPAERSLYTKLPALLLLQRARLFWRNEARVLASRNPSLMAPFAAASKRFLARSIPDPHLRKRLTPDYTIGCKRILMSNDFYPALREPHVHLVTDPIRHLTPTGVHTSRDHTLDVLIFGTGFQASDMLAPFPIRNGPHDLGQTWDRAPEAYLGSAVHGFPNLFVLTGPNTGLGHSSMLIMIEAQARYVAQAVHALHRLALKTLEVRPDVQRAFNDDLQRQLQPTVWIQGGCTSWYKTDDGLNTTLWPTFTVSFQRATATLDLDDYTTTPLHP